MKVSFIIPTHNCGVWLPHAVASCLEQTHSNIEVIVVDDGSTDLNTADYLGRFSDKRMLVIRLLERQGRSAARNLGNKDAQGDVICVLDADDISTPNRAELTVAKLNRTGADYVYGAATVIDCLGRPQPVIDYLGRPQQVIAPQIFDRKLAFEPPYQNRIVHSTAAYNRNFARMFPYKNGDISTLGLDDWAQQIEGLNNGMKFDYIPQRLACYRLLQKQISRTRCEKAVLTAKMDIISRMGVPV